MKWCVLLGLLVPSVSLGQVNTERLRSWQAPGASGSADLRIEQSGGNVELINVGSTIRLAYAEMSQTYVPSSTVAQDPPENLVYLVGDFAFGSRDGEAFNNAGFAHLRWTHMFNPLLGFEVYVQGQFNEFILLQERYVGGTGFRLEAFNSGVFQLALGSGVMAEQEVYDVEAPLQDQLFVARSTSYLSLRAYADDPKLELITTVYWQPRLGDGSDQRVLNDAEVAFMLGKQLSMAVTFGLRFDTEPPDPSLVQLDTQLGYKLRYSF